MAAEFLVSTLFPKSRRMILGLLMGHPDRAFYLREIAQLTHLGVGQLAREVDRLVKAGIVRRFKQGRHVYFQESQTPGLGPEWRLSIAYNAALQLATAALAAAGYRVERQNKHQRTIECLAFTVRLERRDVDFLDLCRRKRHSNVYDQVGAISEQEADEMVAFAKNLRNQVVAWLHHDYPSLSVR